MEKQFEISCDSTADLYFDEYKKLNVFMAPLSYVISKDNELNDELDDYKSFEEYENFYSRLKDGYIAKTSILNVQAHIDLFSSLAKKGVKKLIHISQGYGLSPTVDNAKIAIETVRKDYPDIDFVAIESNTTTVGEGMIVRACIKLRDEGKTLEETLEKIEKIKKYTQHFILVNDLKFLARGGRISQASASLGSLFQVKPIIEFNKLGKLQIVRKEMGLNKALNSIVNEFQEFSLNEEFPYIYIVHTGNLPLAEKLQAMLFEKYNIKPEIRIMGPIIGAHVGPSAVAYAFISNEERKF